MTFTEAAAEILRLVGRPLHYKKITELAIERNLLSHVGKAPELTMSSRLATIVKKDNEGGLIKVKPGVFALRSFSKAALALADDADDVDLSQLPQPEAAPPPPVVARPEGEAGEPARRLPGADVFPVEDDDDRPILADLDEPDGKDAEGDEEGRKGRRRRRRRGRKDDDMSEAGDGAQPREEGEASEPREGGERAEGGEGESRRSRERGERDRGRGRDRNRGDRDRDRNDRDRDRDRGDRDGGRRFGRDAQRMPEVDLNREPADGDLLGKDLADACFHVLSQSADAAAVTYTDLARLLVQRGRLSGDPAALAPTVAAAVRADVARGETGRMARPRFRHVPTPNGVPGVGLTGWYYARDVVHRERDAMRALDRFVDGVRRSFLRKLADLPAGGFAELLATWLNHEGVGALRGVRRPGSSGTEMHFAGVRRRGPEEVRIGIVVLRGQREDAGAPVGRERVTEMRGSAHHYGNATELWIVTTGAVQSGAREEASVQATVPVALFDGLTLAQSMEQARIGMTPVAVMVPSLDLDLFDALRGTVEPPSRDREREQRPDPRDAKPRAEQSEPHAESPKDGEAAEGEEAEGAEGEAGENAETEEGGRRRRRRRRRRGGRDSIELPAGAAAAEGADAADPDADGESSDEDDERDIASSAASAAAVDDGPSTDEVEQPDDSEEDSDDPAAGDSEDDE